jgi:hypothetical protein
MNLVPLNKGMRPCNSLDTQCHSELFAPSNTGIVGSNPTQGMDVYMCVYSVSVVLCVGSGLATG